ncbi:kinase-like domain [Cordyceps militaris]|uniref:Kinase-like domain n=1 Tax=Cordyceps militaris TaxID=73501 RepID=A0A2H4SB70_CORMI|nr:kinase-like domain [Cordyceps militaris]
MVQPSEVEFLNVLKKDENDRVMVYKVKIGHRLCIMKVFRGQGDCPSFSPDVEPRLFLRESRAYRLLKEKGFCERGVVPDFYGTIENIDVALWPDLSHLKDDVFPPDAVLLEYIPNLERIGPENFLDDNIKRLSQTLQEFHEMGLLHGDTFPRNMMVVRQQPRDRVLWIDFDCAQIVQRGKCEEWTEKSFSFEGEMMAEFAEFLAEDAKTGEINKTWLYYYD